ncbi:MAG: site-specific DNA-methyltransferase [Polyangiaceae bacterium]|nr:site-specific DNA-methyltransferase [Polyangiaceae bacterium]
MPGAEREKAQRRSLTHVGGETRTRGDRDVALLLAKALDVGSSIESDQAEAEARAHVHGFHTYPARMHPGTARRLIESFSREGDRVLDPFCGSGTVLVEARAAKRVALGVDLNPLAVRLARRKVTPSNEAERAAILDAAKTVAEVAESRRLAKAGASRRYGKEDVALFDPHVLLELDGLRTGVESLPVGVPRDTLALVLSSILVKLSRKAGDTSDTGRKARIAAGFPTRVFLDKTRELTERFAAIEEALVAGPDARVDEGDARSLRHIGPSTVSLVVSSPPYAGVYDYLEHHRMRLRWLGLHDRKLEHSEIGARRQLAKMPTADAWQAFFDQMCDVLAAVRRVLVPGGKVALVIGDATRGRDVLASDELIADAGTQNHFEVTAVGSQSRPNFYGQAKTKLEHVVLLTKQRA